MKSLKIFFLLATVLMSGSFSTATPFAGATDLGSGNRYLSWFDYFNDQFYPWVFHFDHGWLYCDADSNDSVWMWNPGLGWVWTNAASYPNLYEENRGWVFYARGSVNPRWFFDRYPEEWVSDAAVSSSSTYFPVPQGTETHTWQYEVNNGQPVIGRFDELVLSFDFNRYDVTFSGSNLLYQTTMEADLSGSVQGDGAVYPVAGFLEAHGLEQYVRDALGVYIEDTQVGLQLGFSVAGDDFLVSANATTDALGELLVNLPWREDLYEFPVGTIYDQWVADGWMSGSYEIVVNDVEQDQNNFSTPFSPAIRYELIDKIPLYFLNGRSYNNVVVIRASIMSPDPFGGASTYLDTGMWLAPGVGLIRSSQEDPMFDNPVEIILVDSSLW